jgi:pimeloyl-ACP methyl ester carboxylesterase
MWDHSDADGVVLVHGAYAHARWWDHIAPWLAEDRRVVAIDLSGHGDSAWRKRYDLETWAREVAIAAEAAGMVRPLLIGHSMGGTVAALASAIYGSAFSGLILVDSSMGTAPTNAPLPQRDRALVGSKTYATLQTAVENFRLRPAQDDNVEFVLRHIAAESLRCADETWSWKFDPRTAIRDPPSQAVLDRMRGPVALLRSEYGIVTRHVRDELLARLPDDTTLIELPGAGHHSMIDQPLALVAALRTLLAVWPHTVAGADRS